MTGPTKETKRRTLGVVLGVAVGFFLVGMIFAVTATFSLVSVIRENQKVSLETNRLIASCVTPQGECYKDGQQRTGAAVASIGQTSVYAAACADSPGVQGAVEIEKCIRRLIKEAKDPEPVP